MNFFFCTCEDSGTVDTASFVIQTQFTVLTFQGKNEKRRRNNNFPIFFYGSYKCLLKQGTCSKEFFLVCNARVMKPMEKLWENKIPRFDTFWGGGWKGSDLLSFILLQFCYSLKTIF